LSYSKNNLSKKMMNM